MTLVKLLWIVPVLPLIAAGAIALLRESRKKLAAGLAIGSMAAALVLSCAAFMNVAGSGPGRQFYNVRWFELAGDWVEIGWVLDPLSSVMLVMVSLTGLLIFVYSLGYMAHDSNFTRFFCFLSLFAGAMLGLVISNSLLLLFICWELVGLASYLLIGFWYQKPSAAAAAKKAFITTRIGDLAFLLGMVWLHSQAGTLLLFNDGHGCIETGAVTTMTLVAVGPITAATAIGLLIFAGAAGKSGQVPFHVWLPDAMEGPTPVSALIHAATMVAAGVFLVARVYPLMAAGTPALGAPLAGETGLVQIVEVGQHAISPALKVITWVGVLTALFAASIAVTQNDIKRILAYSTVSQLGFMMMGLGVGGVAAGMFHLITHAFFKALLFLGAGSVIHGSHEEHDIRRMGGLRRLMPVTFAVYAAGMLALSGFPLLFSGFWSKDGILHAAHAWPGSHWPFYLGVLAAFLTAFYMMRQVIYVFFGRRTNTSEPCPHESPMVMLAPMTVLAVLTVLLGFIGTPAWPWFQSFINGTAPGHDFGRLGDHGILLTMIASGAVALAGMGLGWWVYSRKPEPAASVSPEALPADPLETRWPETYRLLSRKYLVDEIYDWSLVTAARWFARTADWLDRTILAGAVQAVSSIGVSFSWLSRACDEFLVNLGFDAGCDGLSRGGRFFSRWQTGRVQGGLKVIGAGLIVLILLLIWGLRKV